MKSLIHVFQKVTYFVVWRFLLSSIEVKLWYCSFRDKNKQITPITAHHRIFLKSQSLPDDLTLFNLPSLPFRLCGYATCAENNKKSSPNQESGSTARSRVKCMGCLKVDHREKRPNCRTSPYTSTRHPQGIWHQPQAEADLTVGFCPDRHPLTMVQG